MANDCQLELMKSVHEMMASPIQSAFIFRGNVNSYKELSDIKATTGDLMIDKSTEKIYCYTGNEWILMCSSYGPTSDLEQTKETITEVAEMKCKNCGAPLIKYNKYSRTVKCEYCDSVYDIREVQYSS